MAATRPKGMILKLDINYQQNMYLGADFAGTWHNNI
jgi:hypothetical protein